MAKNRNSLWAQEIQLEEISQEKEGNIPQNLLSEAYEALNRFHQKEQKRCKHSKRKKFCWQE